VSVASALFGDHVSLIVLDFCGWALVSAKLEVGTYYIPVFADCFHLGKAAHSETLGRLSGLVYG
jgi:hypothetical protein